jgi:hypothetical protein
MRVLSLKPDREPEVGGKRVTVTGDGFRQVTRVEFGTTICRPSVRERS